jgi:bifunctional ADP-heptose synthase (sugar kinase/adenylyltransferase)
MSRKNIKVLVYGDIIEDRYTRCVTTRDCPEQIGAPVLDVVESSVFDGCAGNVFQNALTMGACLMAVRDDVSFDVEVAGICGPKFYARQSWRYPGLVADPGIVKERLIVDDRITCRVDSKKVFTSIPPRPVCLESHYDLAIISDYCFGAVEPDIVQAIMQRSKYVVVDSKRQDLSMFKGATLFKLNTPESTRQFAGQVMSLCNYYVISKGENGLTLIDCSNAEIRYFDGHRVKEVDVTGCGDTLTAAIGLALALGRPVTNACMFGNYLASRVVQHMGPSFPNYDEVKEAEGRYL